MKFFFVINPVSGGRVKNEWESAIREYFKNLPHQTEFYVLTGENDRKSIEHHLSRTSPDRVVAVGGDGTVQMLANILKESSTPLGIIPAGSANGMARELEIPVEPVAALDLLVNGRVARIDLVKVNEEHICIHLSDLGLNARLVKYFEKSKSRGMWGYGKSIFKILIQKQKMKVTICTEEGEIKREAFMVTLANARKYGTGANINPDGDIGDGQFEIVIVKKLNLIEIMRAIFTEQSFNPKRIEVLSTRNAEITVHRKAHFQVDGEYLGKVTKVTARVMAKMLRLVVPEKEAVG